VDNAQFTEDQRAEAFRLEHAGHLQRQTKALESIRTYVGVLLAVVILGVIFSLVGVLVTNSPGL
jgi:hypothetical protein